MIFTLLNIELEKLFRKGRTYIGIVAVLVIVLVIQGGMKLEGQGFVDFISENLRKTFLLQGNLLNGYLIAYLSINSLWIHIPILIIIVTGDLVSGETSIGTFRISLTRPVRRSSLLIAKFMAGMIYVLILVIILAVLSLGLGLLFFGKGDLIVFLDAINIIPGNVLFSRFLMAFGFGIISMWMVAALSFLFSVIADNSLTPILLSMAIIILFTILSNFDMGLFSSLKPYLFTHHMSNWRLFFEYELDFNQIFFSLNILILHMFALIALSLVLFIRKDITS